MLCQASLPPRIMPTSTFDLTAKVKAQAVAEGFSSVGICAPDAVDITEQLRAFTDAGMNGQMAWMAERQLWRARPDVLWPQARSVIMVSESYAPDGDPLQDLAHPQNGAISVYAKGRDYHDIVKKRLKRLARWLIAEGGGAVKVFVDTAPVPEKPLAQAAGLGWQGKHTNLVSRQTGNWMFLGSVFTTLDLQADPPETDHCGSCHKCLDICPTKAFVGPYQLDARRCISYLTIEHKGPVPTDLRPALGNRIYGCDDCLAVCPWNKFAVEAADIRYGSHVATDLPDLSDLLRLDDATFRTQYAGSAIKRIGRAQFIRNVIYAIGNSGRPEALSQLAPFTTDPDPTLADAAVWAQDRIKDLSQKL